MFTRAIWGLLQLINYVNKDINLLRIDFRRFINLKKSDRRHTHTHKKYVQISHKKYDQIAKKRQKAKKRGNWLFNLSIKYENITTRFTQSTKLKHVHLQIIYTIWMCVLYVPHRWAHNSVASATWNRITGLIYTIVDFYNFNWFSATKTESINKTTFSNALRQHTQTHWCGLLPFLMRCSQLSYRIYVVAIQHTKFSKILSTAQLKTMIITCQKNTLCMTVITYG